MWKERDKEGEYRKQGRTVTYRKMERGGREAKQVQKEKGKCRM